MALVAFHGDVGPLVVHNWESTSIREPEFLIFKAFRDDGVEA